MTGKGAFFWCAGHGAKRRDSAGNRGAKASSSPFLVPRLCLGTELHWGSALFILQVRNDPIDETESNVSSFPGAWERGEKRCQREKVPGKAWISASPIFSVEEFNANLYVMLTQGLPTFIFTTKSTKYTKALGEDSILRALRVLRGKKKGLSQWREDAENSGEIRKESRMLRGAKCRSNPLS